MPMIQIRNVPEEVHRELKVQAASEGMTLSDYLLDELREIATRPSMPTWLARVRRRREPVHSSITTSEAIHRERERLPPR
jgi:plasmid stability protein